MLDVLFSISMFSLGLLVGSIIKGIHINITHKHEHSYQNQGEPSEYNSSYGDPDQKLFFDRQYQGSDD